MEISNWLISNRDYEQGRKLYEKHSANPVLKNLFALGPSAYNCKKLVSELEKLKEPEPVKVKRELPPHTPEKAVGLANHFAAEMVLVQLRPLLAEQAALQAQLDMPQSTKERYQRAHRIMELADRIEPLWRDYHYAKEHGKLPEPKVKKLPATEADQLRRLNNLRTYRTRYKDRPDKLKEIVEEIKKLEELLYGKK